jgi:hypothetical protein
VNVNVCVNAPVELAVMAGFVPELTGAPFVNEAIVWFVPVSVTV